MSDINFADIHFTEVTATDLGVQSLIMLGGSDIPLPPLQRIWATFVSNVMHKSMLKSNSLNPGSINQSMDEFLEMTDSSKDVSTRKEYMDSMNGKGFVRSMMIKEDCFNKLTNKAIQGGAKQLLVLNGRLDCNGLINAFHNKDSLKVFEVSDGEMFKLKQFLIESLKDGSAMDDWKEAVKIVCMQEKNNYDVVATEAELFVDYLKDSKNIEFIEHKYQNIADNLPQNLEAKGFDLQKQTVTMGKGFSMYQEHDITKGLIRFLDGLKDSSYIMDFRGPMGVLGTLGFKHGPDKPDPVKNKATPREIFSLFKNAVCKFYAEISDGERDNISQEWVPDTYMLACDTTGVNPYKNETNKKALAYTGIRKSEVGLKGYEDLSENFKAYMSQSRGMSL